MRFIDRLMERERLTPYGVWKKCHDAGEKVLEHTVRSWCKKGAHGIGRENLVMLVRVFRLRWTVVGKWNEEEFPD